MEQFVQWLQEQTGIRPSARNAALRRYLADQFDYRNRTKSLRRIDALLEQGQLSDEMRDRLVTVLHVKPEVIDEKISAAQEEYFRQKREIFFASQGVQLVAIVPRPKQIFLAGLVYDHKRYLKLPTDLLQCSEKHQRTALRQAIEDFISREGTSIPLFGPVSGFAYINSPHTHWLLDTQGQVIERSDKPFANQVFAARLS